MTQVSSNTHADSNKRLKLLSMGPWGWGDKSDDLSSHKSTEFIFISSAAP